MQEPRGHAFERYLAEVDHTHPERQRYRPGLFQWWHLLPVVLMLGGALAAWRVG